MKIRKSTTKNLICFILTIAMFVLSLSGILSFVKPSFSSYSAGDITNLVKNNNFNQSTDNDKPVSPNNFDPTVEEKDSSVTAGVINLKKGKFTGKAKEMPKAEDSCVLLIDSTTTSGNTTTSHNVNFGYHSHDYINLLSNSHYIVTADVYTDSSNGIANLYLIDENNRYYGSVQNISSKNTWTTVTILVSTNEYVNTNIKLGLYLKKAGFVLFDNLSAYQISQNDLNTRLNNLKNTNTIYSYVDKRDDDVYINDLSSTNFYAEVLGDSSAVLTDKTQDSNATDNISNSALKITNNTKSYSKYTTVKDIAVGEITEETSTKKITNFTQNYIYKVSVNAKVVDLTGSASLELKRTDDKENKTYSVTLSSSSNSMTNGYNQYNFYVKSPINRDATFKLSALLGSSDDSKQSSGTLYISTIRVSKVDYSTFSNAKNSTDCKIDLSNSDDTNAMKNGYFNAIEVTDGQNPFPATPSNWSVTLGKNLQHYGVVNTSQFDLINSVSNIEINPGDPGLSPVRGNNNVLMMHNTVADSISYKSEAKDLDANSYYSFSVQVQLQRKTNDKSNHITVSLMSDLGLNETTLATTDVTTTAGDWQTVKFYVRTGAQDIKAYLKVTLNSNDEAFAYVDNALFNVDTVNKDNFDDLTLNPVDRKIDLNDLLLTTSTDDFSTASLFDYSTTDGVEAGVVNVKKQYIFEGNEQAKSNVVKDAYIEEFKKVNAENVLAIRASHDVHYTMKSQLGYDLKKGKYYTISVDVFTQNLQVLSSDDKSKMGASLSLTNFDNSFKAITSNGEWTTYTFYIHVEDDASDVTTNLELSLGSNELKTTGDVFFANFTMLESNKDEFASKSNDSKSRVLVKSKEVNSDTTDNNESNENNNTSTPASNWLYYVSSILFALAIIVAVVGVMLRKIKWKKPTKKSKNEYDRNKTVSKQYYMRKATALKESRIIELNKDLKSLTDERTKYEEEYKHGLSKLREMKIKKASSAEISKFEKEMRKNQRLSSQIGVQIKNIESELQYMNTDAYLNSLIKSLEENKLSDEQQK